MIVHLPRIALALAKELAVFAEQLRGAPRAKQRLLDYTELRKRSGQSFAMIGIGQHLGAIVRALHAADLPHGLTLLVRPKDGDIDFSADNWLGIDASNALEHRRKAVEFDWSTVEFALA